MQNILTFDIEEWYLYPSLFGDTGSELRLEKYLEQLLNTLDNRNIKATFFVLGKIARNQPHIIQKIFNFGHEIGCHSDVHIWLTRLNEKQFYEDTHKAISSIENVIGSKVFAYRAPAFSITPQNKWALETLKKLGIEYDSSIFPAKRDFGGFSDFSTDIPTIIEFNGIQIKEFPISVINFLGKKIAYSGGGYFRLLPYSIIKKILYSKEYNMTYFHIRDFDKEQFRNFNFRYFKNYYGVNSAKDKFQKLIYDFEFININKASSIIDWTKSPLIKL